MELTESGIGTGGASAPALRRKPRWLEYGILLAAGLAGYEMKKPFGLLLHRIMDVANPPAHSLIGIASNQGLQILVIVALACLVHRRTSLPAAPWLERVVYGEHRGERIRVWVPGLLGALATLLLGGAILFVAGRFGIVRPLTTRVHTAGLSHAIADRLALLYPPAAVGAALSEEVMYRFGLFTILAWLISRVVPARGRWKIAGLGIALVVQALVFGLAHVQEGITQLPVGGMAVQVIVAPQTWAGLVFGYLYMEYGLETSIVAHASTDLFQLAFLVLAAIRHAR